MEGTRRLDVLLVEDNVGDARLVSEALAASHQPWGMRRASSLAEARAAAGGKRFDAILLDLSLPDSQGFATVAAVRALFPDTAIVVLTGLDDPAIEQRIVEAGAQDYLVKGDLMGEGLMRAIRHAVVRHRLEQRLAESEAKHRAVVNLAPDAILVVSAPLRPLGGPVLILSANPAAARMFGVAAADGLVGGELSRFLPDVPPLLSLPEEVVQPIRRDGLGHRGGERFPVAIAAAPLGSGRFVVSATDITERVRLAENLLQQARTDALTGLANRRAFIEAAELEFEAVCRRGHESSVLMIDADHFKCINDSQGHEAGDTALVYLAAALKFLARSSDLPARFGGEEFVVLLVGTKMEGALEMAERIRAQIAAGQLDGPSGPFGLTVSIGVASFAATDVGWEDAVRRADQAVYAAKESGRNRVVARSAAALPTAAISAARVRKP